jgi:hypothetical protein
MDAGRFHPGCISRTKLKPKLKPKRCLVKTKRPLLKLNRLLPLESIEESYQTGFLMQHFSILNTFKAGSDNLALVAFYESSPVLQPSVLNLKRTLQRRSVWFFRNQGLRTAFKRLAQIWLYKKYRGRHLNSVDVATLEEPKKPIYVYDAKAKGVYGFEATTLRRSIDSDLSFTDWLFPDPQAPRNAWTNCPFTIPQLLSIQTALYKYEMCSIFLQAYKGARWNLVQYVEIYKVPIKLAGLQNMLRNKTSDEYIVLLTEFIEDEFEYHDIDYASTLTILKWAIVHCNSDPYMLEWTDCFEEYTRICIFNSSRVLDRADALFDRTHVISYALLRRHKEIARLGRQRLCAAVR